MATGGRQQISSGPLPCYERSMHWPFASSHSLQRETSFNSREMNSLGVEWRVFWPILCSILPVKYETWNEHIGNSWKIPSSGHLQLRSAECQHCIVSSLYEYLILYRFPPSGEWGLLEWIDYCTGSGLVLMSTMLESARQHRCRDLFLVVKVTARILRASLASHSLSPLQ